MLELNADLQAACALLEAATRAANRAGPRLDYWPFGVRARLAHASALRRAALAGDDAWLTRLLVARANEFLLRFDDAVARNLNNY